jgi:opacity protein-like surface antigen
MVNVDPDFDTLNYSYNVNSYALQATAKLSKLNLIHHFGFYLQAGAGGARNYFTNYTESSPTGSSAAPMLAPFSDDSTARFAYTLGGGILYQPGETMRVSLGYRYMNMGSGQFRKSPVQQTDNTLTYPLISYQFLILTVSA